MFLKKRAWKNPKKDGDALMGIDFISITIVIIQLATVFVLYLTIKSNINLNKKNILNELVRQERELRIKLSEYRGNINRNKSEKKILLKLNWIMIHYYLIIMNTLHFV